MAAASKTESSLNRAMRDSLKAYAAGDRKFFKYLRDDVRVYTLDSASPLVGRKAFESYFGSTFTKTKRNTTVVAQDIQRSGNQAVLAQTLQITARGVVSHIRQTVIWNQAEGDGDWKMSHIHNALVGQPLAVGKPPKSAQSIRVLNERIATVAATVGVAQ